MTIDIILKDWLPWIISVLGILSMYLAGERLRAGWAVGLANQAFWVVWIVVSGSWGLLLATAALSVVFLRNLLNWSKPAAAVPEFRNPPTVVVAIVPVTSPARPGETGLLMVRRAIPPVGGLALPGGYHVEGESWQEALKRELREETGLDGVTVLRVADVVTVREGRTNLLFGECAPVELTPDHVFVTDAETQAVEVIWEPKESCFPVHTARIDEFFARHCQTGS